MHLVKGLFFIYMFLIVFAIAKLYVTESCISFYFINKNSKQRHTLYQSLYASFVYIMAFADEIFLELFCNDKKPSHVYSTFLPEKFVFVM